MTNNLSKEALSKLYGKVSPFEFKDKLIELAKLNNVTSDTIFDAGRGNPNWTCSTPRQAFFTFGQFAVLETQLSLSIGDLSGMVKKDGIANRLRSYIEKNSTAPGIDLISNIIEYGISILGFNPDDWVFELTDAIIGDNYPFPDRMLTHIEKIVHNYLIKELCGNKTFENDFDVFSVEGGTAAMCYIFDSLASNRLLNKGDKIALMTPIFTPYLEIPHLPKYEFDVINLYASGLDEDDNKNWQYPIEELEKLKDTNIKALFIVNPNNPASISLSDDCKANLVNIVKEYNPNLMIVTDDVYCTFVNNFSSIVADLPYNTLCVYSLSKYFGVTGWRLGTIMLNSDNVFNKLISELPSDEKKLVDKRYQHMSLTPDKVSFIDRLVADSRQVALNHTAGLSTPQQVQMAFFCAFALLDTDNNYKNLTIDICRNRKKILFESLAIDLISDIHDASYYTELNVLDWATHKYGNKFANYISENYTPFDILYDLAKSHSVILLNGDGFASSQWSLRISLANLKDDDYYVIGNAIKKVLTKLLNDWKNTNL